MPPVAELLLPAISWEPITGYEGSRDLIERALAHGVGGFVVQGGPEADARFLIKELRTRSRLPLLIASDIARGAGQQFGGTTGLPPLAAIAALDDPNLVARAAKLTAREVRPIGVNWGLAPTCDVRETSMNAITGMESIGDSPTSVSSIASAWIEACQHEGMLACARHFPGYGRVQGNGTPTDVPPAVELPRSSLFEHELAPFRAAIASRVASMLVAHVAYPSLDASELPATFSTTILRYLLREKYAFEGLVASDLLAARAPLSAEDEAELAVRALDAGCDLLLCPAHLDALVAALEAAVRDGPLYEDRVDQSRRRRLKWAQWAAPQTDYRKVSGSDVAWALQLAEKVIRPMRGTVPAPGGVVEVIIVDDDPAPPPLHPRTLLLDALGAVGIVARHVDVPASASRAPVLVALHASLREGRGKGGALALREATRERLAAICAAARETGREAVVLLFAPPALGAALDMAEVVVCCWSGDRAMQEAAVRWLTSRTG
jgi:beta-glucosidase-like glycosyl hydrolase